MGLFNRIKDPVDAQYQLTACSMNSGGAVYENCRMEGVVTGPGVGPVAVSHSTLAAPTAKWPQPGDTIPVTVDRNDPTRLKIRWDDMPTNRDRAKQYAQSQAEQMRGGTAGGMSQPGRSDFSGVPPQLQGMLNDFVAQATASGATVTTNVEVVGAPGRPAPGQQGGGFTPDQVATALSGGGAGLTPATATVLAVHEIAAPPGVQPPSPGGVADLTLDVLLPDGTGYGTTMRIAFSTPEKRASVAAVGRTLPVLVNPAARDQVMVDTARLR